MRNETTNKVWSPTHPYEYDNAEIIVMIIINQNEKWIDGRVWSLALPLRP
jgi:hypothetical protein